MVKTMGSSALAKAALIGGCACVLAGRATGGMAPVPSAAEIDHAALREATRAALACAAGFLLERATDPERGFIVEPAVKGHVRKAYTVRFTRKVVEEPIYEWDFEEVLVTRGGQLSEGEDRELVKRRRRKPGSRRQVGVRKVEREVADPNGAIVREYPETRVAERWQYGLPGQNALALYALLEAGVPEQDPAVSRLAGTLRDIVLRYGCPDATWDLAWLTALFSRLRDPSHDEAREWLIHKLLDSQIADGPARGLWGPISVNTALLAAMVQTETRLNTELDKRRAAVRERPASRPRQDRVDEMEAVRQTFIRQYGRVSRQGLRFEDVQDRWVMTAEHDAERITAPGLPFYIYNETVADMESTALALFALGEAARRGHLPKTVWRPTLSGGKPLLPPQSASAILARSAAALARRQQRDGTWFEENTHQPVEHFRALKFRSLPRDGVLDLASEKSALASVQALQSLSALADSVGARQVAGRYGPMALRGRNAALAAAESWLNGAQPLPGARQPLCFAYALMAAGLERPLEGVTDDRPDIRARLAYRLLLAQNADGSWGADARPGYSSGTMAYWEERYRREHEQEQASLPAHRRQPFDADAWWDHHVGSTQNLHVFDAAVTDTAMAIIALARGWRQPLAGYVRESPRVPFPVTLAAGLRAIEERRHVAARCLAVEPNTPASVALSAPVLFLDARSPLAQPGIRGLVQQYLRGTGLLIAEVHGGANPAAMEKTLLSLLGEGSRIGPAPAELVPASARANLPPLSGVFDRNNRLAALFLPARAGALAEPIIADRLPKGFFEPGHALDTGGTPPETARAIALASLTGQPEPSTPARRRRASATAAQEPDEPPAWDAVPDVAREQAPADDEVW